MVQDFTPLRPSDRLCQGHAGRRNRQFFPDFVPVAAALSLRSDFV